LGSETQSAPECREVRFLAPATSVHLNAALAPESQARPQGRPTALPVTRHPRPLRQPPSRQVFPDNAAATASRSPDPVTDSMGVLWLCLIWAAGAALAGARACLAHCLFMIFQLRAAR